MMQVEGRETHAYRPLQDGLEHDKLVPCDSSRLARVCDLEEHGKLFPRNLLKIARRCDGIDEGVLVKVSG